MSNNQSVQVLTRATSILRILAKNTGGMSLGQIATAGNLPRSTVQRIVATLAEEGFVSLGSSHGGIRLGPEVQSLARAVIGTPRDRFRPVLEAISADTGETVDLAVLRGDKMLFIDQVVGGQRLRTVSSIGETFPLTTTANGKAALACLDEFDATNLIMAEQRELASKDRRLTEVLTEIAEIRSGGLAYDNREYTDDISALGFGIKDHTGEVFAVSLPVPSSRFARNERQLRAAMSKAAERLGRQD